MRPIWIFWIICAVMFAAVYLAGCASREDRYWSQVSEGIKHVEQQ